jgi:hypothetical protein
LPGGVSHSPPVPKQTIISGPTIRIAIDEKRKRVIFDRWGEIGGKSAELLIALAGPFRRALSEERSTEHYPFTTTSAFMRQTNCGDNETLRRQISRCRNKIAQSAMKAGDPSPSLDAVIETSQWRGYRLNPDQVRILAIMELLRKH